MTYKLTIAYDGTHYVGWQIQPNGNSIQAEIQRALSTFLKEEVSIVGAGRTDAGVHALGQVAHFETELTIDPIRFIHALNGILPHDIRIKRVERASDDFHARYSAKSKIYHYHLWLDGPVDPWLRLYRHRPKQKLSLPLLKQGAQEFLGKRDFTSFANTGGGSKSFTRTLYRLDVVEQEGGVRLEFEGDGFLYKMVRNIVGTLLEVASQKRKVEEIKSLLKAKDRQVAGIAAPPRGLFMIKVNYHSALQEKSNEQRSCSEAFQALSS